MLPKKPPHLTPPSNFKQTIQKNIIKTLFFRTRNKNRRKTPNKPKKEIKKEKKKDKPLENQDRTELKRKSTPEPKL
jgi:hypothetical protein